MSVQSYLRLSRSRNKKYRIIHARSLAHHGFSKWQRANLSAKYVLFARLLWEKFKKLFNQNYISWYMCAQKRAAWRDVIGAKRRV